MEYFIDPALLQRRVEVLLVGAGGSGGWLAPRLARLDLSMRAKGHPLGLRLTAIDPSFVRAANVGRQAFSSSDVGQHKALLTVERINRFYGLDWTARPTTIEQEWEGRNQYMTMPDIVVSCVDTRSARRYLHHYMLESKFKGLWLDLGNDMNSGQVVLGEPGTQWDGRRNNRWRLPTVCDLFQELLDDTAPDSNVPSCSVADSLDSQGLFVNDTIATFAAQLLYQLFTHGKLEHHGLIFNLDSLRCGPIEVDPATWARFGVCLTDSEREQERAA